MENELVKKKQGRRDNLGDRSLKISINPLRHSGRGMHYARFLDVGQLVMVTETLRGTD